MEARAFDLKLTLGLMLGVFLFSQAVALSQTAQPGGNLSVNGHAGQVIVIQINGKSYVDIEALARLANGSISFNGDQINLTVPSAGASTPTPTPTPSGLSKGFVAAGIETMASIREWRSALVVSIQNSYAVTPNWMSNNSASATSNLKLASLAVSTDSDRQAFQLLTNVFNNMKTSTQRFVTARQNLTYISQTALDNDPLDQKIVACGHALAAMEASGQFQDAASCH